MRELKEELEARGEPKTGNKAWLRRRLHGAIVCAHIWRAQTSIRNFSVLWDQVLLLAF